MSQKPNPTSIGLFIVTGLALGVIALLLFGSSRLFTQTRDCIVYFNESLNGLNEGAPVKFRGVTIGSVKRVMVHFNQAPHDYAMPVIIEFQEDLIRERMGEQSEFFTQHALEERIKLGLRASLQAESLVTGVLYVEIRPNRNAPPPVFHQLQKRYPEIPSQPTQIQELLNNLAGLDVKGIVTNVNTLIAKLDVVLDNLRMGDITTGLTNTLASIDRLVASPEITNSLAAVRTTLDQYRALGDKLNGRIDPLAESITNSLAEANRTLAELRGAADNLRGMLRPDAPLRNDLDQLLQQLAGAAESISSLVEFLKQHPNALITGREVLPKKP
jgi:paraquat-inducible protein B